MSQQSEQSEQMEHIDEIMQNYESALRDRVRLQQIANKQQQQIEQTQESSKHQVLSLENEIENLVKKNEQLLQILQTKEQNIEGLEDRLQNYTVSEQQIFQSEQVQNLIFQNQQLLSKLKEMEIELMEKDKHISLQNEKIQNVEQLLKNSIQNEHVHQAKRATVSPNNVALSEQQLLQMRNQNSLGSLEHSLNNSSLNSRQSSRPNSRSQNKQYSFPNVLNKSKTLASKRPQSAARTRSNQDNNQQEKPSQFIYKPLQMLYKDNKQMPVYFGGQKSHSSARNQDQHFKEMEKLTSLATARQQDHLRGKPEILSKTKALSKNSSLQALVKKNNSKTPSPVRTIGYNQLDWRDKIIQQQDKRHQPKIINQNNKDLQYEEFDLQKQY